MADLETVPGTPSCCIVITPNRSLSFIGLVAFYCGLAALSLSIAVLLAVMGLWPVLPFAGLEMLFLGACLYAAFRRGAYTEIVSIDRDWVRVTKSEGKKTRQVAFQRHRAHLRTLRPAARSHASRLVIRSHGRGCEVGSCLTEEQRHALRDRLQTMIGPVNQTPWLA